MEQIIGLTIIYIEDITGPIPGFTSFIAEFPGAVGEGDTREQAKESVIEALKFLLDSNTPKEELENQEPERFSITQEKLEFKLLD